MTGGSAEKAVAQLRAAMNQGKDPPRWYEPENKLGFPDLDVFTSEAIDRINVLASGDPARTARLSARVLEIAQRECAMPVLPDLVDEAAAELDLEPQAHAEPEAEGSEPQAEPQPQPNHEYSAPRANIKPLPDDGMPPPEPFNRPRHDDPGQQIANTAPGVAAPRPRRLLRVASGAVGAVVIVSGVAGYLAYAGQLDTRGLGNVRTTVTSSLAAAIGNARETVTSSLAAAINLVQPGGQQQISKSGDIGASSPPLPPAEAGPPGGSAVGGNAAGPGENDREDDQNGGRNGGDRDEIRNEAVAVRSPAREEDRRADEVILAERWPESGEAAEEAIKQRFRDVIEQAEQARQTLEAVEWEMDQLHRAQDEETQARHARELAEAGAEGADAAQQAQDRHQQEWAALQHDRIAERDRLAAIHDQLDRQLQGARRDVVRAREEAIRGSEAGDGSAISRLHLHEQPKDAAISESSAAASPEESTADGGLATESGLQPQSEQPQSEQPQPEQPQPEQSQPDTADDRRQHASAAAEDSAEGFSEFPGMVLVVPGQTEPQAFNDEEAAPEPIATTEPQRDDEEAAPEPVATAGQPVEPLPPSSPLVETGRDTPAAEDVVAGRTEAMTPEAAAAPAGEPTIEPHRDAAPVSQDVADLVERGNTLLDFGDLASARLFYRLAAGRGNPEGAMLMGMTFDPVYFARAGIRGTQPQIQDALEWYRKAIAMGSVPAETRMGQLRSWLEQSAADGDPQAKAALQQLR